jgi:hypothetical protein
MHFCGEGVDRIASCIPEKKRMQKKRELKEEMTHSSLVTILSYLFEG